jgi:UDPglucose 6-dehydrogenase
MTAIDIHEEVVATLNEGRAAIDDPGLEELLETHVGDRLEATTSYDAVPTFLTIETPSFED